VNQPTTDGTAVADASSRIGGNLPVSLATLLGALALVPTAGVLVLRLLRNAPATLPPVARSATPVVTALAAVVPALAVLGLALGCRRRPERVALAALGVFALLGAADGAAWLPAAAATLVGGATVLALELRSRADERSRSALRRHARPLAVATLGVLALGASLAVSAGLATVALRPVGAGLAFATLASLPLVRSVDGTVELGLWVVATLAVVVGAASAPFVAGAVVLVAFGAGTIPLALLALGLGGGIATVVADTGRNAFGPAVAAALLLFAGVPGTLPRAVAFTLGLVVLVREWGPTARSGTDDSTATAGGVADA